ncbi:LysR family transcriptional regulator [Rhodobacteraceae bacterium F11138]|nr:LysR family transcriptional regulator [Rhodobacteraceae bacterium F11138]
MSVTFRQLRQFLVLSQELHFGRAAVRLGISQPPLSTSLRQMEERLGFALMVRSSKSVSLTPAGKVFAEHAARILGQMDAARAAAADTAQGMAGELTVAFVPAMLLRYLPTELRAFRESHPQVELALREMNTTEQIEGLLDHSVDVGFVHAVPFPDEIEQHVLETERLVCCLPPNHRLAGRSRVSITELASDPVLVFARDFAAQYHDKISGLLHAAGIEPASRFHIRHWFTVVTLVAQGMGVSLVPASLARSNFVDVTYIEIEEGQAEHDVVMIWRRGETSKALAAFLARFGVTADV